jgi:hypothetical protein
MCTGGCEYQLHIQNLRLTPPRTLLDRFFRHQERMKSPDNVHRIQHLTFMSNMHVGIEACFSAHARNPGQPQTISVACSSADLLAYSIGKNACLEASSLEGEQDPSFILRNSFDFATGVHTIAGSTAAFAELFNGCDLGMDGYQTKDNFLFKVMPEDPDISSVAVYITADVYYNPGTLQSTIKHMHTGFCVSARVCVCLYVCLPRLIYIYIYIYMYIHTCYNHCVHCACELQTHWPACMQMYLVRVSQKGMYRNISILLQMFTTIQVLCSSTAYWLLSARVCMCSYVCLQRHMYMYIYVHICIRVYIYIYRYVLQSLCALYL